MENQNSNAFRPGCYAVIELTGSQSFLLVAEMDEDGRLKETHRSGRELLLEMNPGTSGGREMLSEAVRQIDLLARDALAHGATEVDILATPPLSGSPLMDRLRSRLYRHSQVRLHALRRASLMEHAYVAASHDRALPPVEGERLLLAVGGQATQLCRGIGADYHGARLFRLGCADLSRRFFRSDPPAAAMLDRCDAHIEEALAELDPPVYGSVLAARGALCQGLFAAAAASGIVENAGQGSEMRGARMSHSQLGDLRELLCDLPLAFRRRVPGLKPELAPHVLAGALLLHQVMARLSLPQIYLSTSGTRQGWIYRMSAMAPLQRKT